MAIVKRDVTKTVGNSIGARKEYLQNQAPAANAQISAQKPVDKFSGVNNRKGSVDFRGFASNTIYKQARARFGQTPHKPAIIEHLENGNIPKVDPNQLGKITKPSDEAMIAFLNRVIDSNSATNIAARATAPAGRALPAASGVKPTQANFATSQNLRTQKTRT